MNIMLALIRHYISIHALHEESDLSAVAFACVATLISIHALHEESDRFTQLRLLDGYYFNPRSP